MGGEDECKQDFGGKARKKEHLEDIDIDGRIILR
jgi:hypothetical protein